MKIEWESHDIPRYQQVYDYYYALILSGKLPEGARLPSIRKGAAQLGMSRTTVETAYLMLAAEGYVLAAPKSGYYVTDMANWQRAQEPVPALPQHGKEEAVRYDFVTAGADRESFRFDLWRRYMKSAMRKDERLLTYGEPQGERAFRKVLSDYLRKHRGVACAPDQIVVGAGVQTLLQLLCPLLDRGKKVAFYNPDFIQGRAVFADYGFSVAKDRGACGVGYYYLSPSQMTKWEGSMPIHERFSLVRWADAQGVLLIEDDYNSEFCDSQRQVPSLQGLAGGRGVVYLGTFSKMLLPSIRMSYMVLPPELSQAYQARKGAYNQTASKVEQIALTQFIRDGHLESQIRKSRKTHLAKAAALADACGRIFADKARVEVEETGFQVILTLRTDRPAAELVRAAAKAGVAVEAEPGQEPEPESESGPESGLGLDLGRVETASVPIEGRGQVQEETMLVPLAPFGNKGNAACEGKGMKTAQGGESERNVVRFRLACANVPTEKYEDAVRTLERAWR